MMKLLTFVSLLLTSIEFPRTTSSFCFTASRNHFHRRIASQCVTQTTFPLSSSWSSSQLLFLTRSRAQRGSLLFVSSNPFLLSSRNEKSSSLSSSSTNDEGKNKSNEGPFYNPLLLFRRAQRKILFIFLSLTTKFMSLSLRAKRFILGQVMVVVMFLAFVVGPQTVGKITQSHHHQRPLKTPIEIPYSSFLNLLREQQMRQQQQSSSTLSSTSFQPPQPNPIVTNVLIGKERITFQIDREAVMLVPRANSATQSTLSLSSSSVKNSITSKTSPKTTMKPPTPKSNSCGKSNLAAAFTRHVPASPELIKLLDQHQVPFAAASTQSATIVTVALRSFLVSFYMLILWRMYRAVSGKGGGGTSTDSVGKLASSTLFGTSNNSPNPVTFDDIEGIDEAKFQVMELVDALKYPDKYAVLGARAPKGLLLEGPPGTGKTMLARATAAMAGVPLLYCSGSDFVEMFVGRGAARVRSTFERAKKLAPCILFIDELDALGKARSDPSGMFRSNSGSNDEAEQTLNQLLACMDGLDSNSSNRKQICVLAATNRANVLDPALLRPGRFDRWVKLELPDSAGRERILRVHARKLPGFVETTDIDKNRLGSLGTDDGAVNLSAVAAVTVGLSGAELESIVNEAAIRAVRRVSAALAYLQRQDPQHHVPLEQMTTPHVESRDFEAAISHFFQTRKTRNNGVNDMLKNVWKA